MGGRAYVLTCGEASEIDLTATEENVDRVCGCLVLYNVDSTMNKVSYMCILQQVVAINQDFAGRAGLPVSSSLSNLGAVWGKHLSKNFQSVRAANTHCPLPCAVCRVPCPPTHTGTRSSSGSGWHRGCKWWRPVPEASCCCSRFSLSLSLSLSLPVGRSVSPSRCLSVCLCLSLSLSRPLSVTHTHTHTHRQTHMLFSLALALLLSRSLGLSASLPFSPSTLTRSHLRSHPCAVQVLCEEERVVPTVPPGA